MIGINRKGRRDTQIPSALFLCLFCPQSHEKPTDDKIHAKAEKTRQKQKEWAKTIQKRIGKGLGMKKNKKNWWGGAEKIKNLLGGKIKNLLGGSLSCAVPGKGEGVYAAPPSVCQCDERYTQKRKHILYTILRPFP